MARNYKHKYTKVNLYIPVQLKQIGKKLNLNFSSIFREALKLCITSKLDEIFNLYNSNRYEFNRKIKELGMTKEEFDKLIDRYINLFIY